MTLMISSLMNGLNDCHILFDIAENINDLIDSFFTRYASKKVILIGALISNPDILDF